MREKERELGMSIEDAIRKLYHSGLSKDEIAAQLGISPQTYWRWLGLLGATFQISFASDEAREAVAS